jgi:hypothetical protein
MSFMTLKKGNKINKIIYRDFPKMTLKIVMRHSAPDFPASGGECAAPEIAMFYPVQVLAVLQNGLFGVVFYLTGKGRKGETQAPQGKKWGYHC